MEAKMTSEAPNGFLSWVDPYLKLFRLHNYLSSFVISWPIAWSIMMATNINTLPLTDTLYNLALFFGSSWLIGGVGSIINDICDREIDKKVSRSKNRPLASGRLTLRAAIVFLLIVMSISGLIMMCLNTLTLTIGLFIYPCIMLYPLMKRWTNYPGVFLGVTCCSGTLLGCTSLTGELNLMVVGPLYLGSTCWVVAHDTVYSFQDIKDDKKAGVKSLAQTFGENSKLVMTILVIAGAVGCALAGHAAQLQWPYYACLALAAGQFERRVATFDPDIGFNMFVSNFQLGLIIFVGIVAGSGNLLQRTIYADRVHVEF